MKTLIQGLLTRHIRNAGAMRAVISTTDLDPASLVEKAKLVPPMEGCNLVDRVTTTTPYFWRENRPDYMNDCTLLDASMWRHKGQRHSVVALDFGIKYNIIRCLENTGCEVLVVPAATPAATIRVIWNPMESFYPMVREIPSPVGYAVDTIRELLG